MSAIANISAALGYDAAERAIMTPGGFARACSLAALAIESSERNDHSPESTRPTIFAADTVSTVRPGKAA